MIVDWKNAANLPSRREPAGAGERRYVETGGVLEKQPRRQVRRLADDRLFAGRALADEVAHDHQAGCNANPCRERFAGRRGQPIDGRECDLARTTPDEGFLPGFEQCGAYYPELLTRAHPQPP